MEGSDRTNILKRSRSERDFAILEQKMEPDVITVSVQRRNTVVKYFIDLNKPVKQKSTVWTVLRVNQTRRTAKRKDVGGVLFPENRAVPDDKRKVLSGVSIHN